MIDITTSLERDIESLVKVELGCGQTKNEGYIGIDRFKLPGVDIVADLNEGIPLKDNSVDVILANNSLEHLDSLFHIMSECYRVCRDRAIVLILAPYYNTTLNQTNIYHKQIFNEDTFRFFSNDSESRCVTSEEYYCPHAVSWGLGQSDNSELLVNFELIHMEFFYYREYRQLAELQKRHARKALSNVCDLIYYVLVVNKGNSLSEEELKILNERAQILEPSIMCSLRERDNVCEPNTSIITDLQEELQIALTNLQSGFQITMAEMQDKIQTTSEELRGEIQTALAVLQSEFETVLNDEINRISENVAQQFLKMEEDIEQESAFNQECYKRLKELREVQVQLQAELKNTTAQQEIVNRNIEQKQMGVNQNLLELLQKQPIGTAIRRKLHLFNRRSNLFPTLNASCPQFIESIILYNDRFNGSSTLQLSSSIPFDTYMEYRLICYGKQLDVYLLGVFGSRCLVEVVSKGAIVKQDVVVLLHEGPHTITLPTVSGEIFVRFRTLDSYSVLRVLEISNRRYGLFAKNSLATYIA